MPKKIKDESGTEIEVFESSEVEAIKAEAERKQKELEQELNPNWREARKKIEDLERSNKEKDDKLAKAGVQSESTGVNKEEVARIASEQAEATYLERYRERVLNQFGDKKETVQKVFDKLAYGEKLSEDAIDRLAADAARTVGISREPDRDLAARNVRGGARPEFEPTSEDEGFGATAKGKATAAVMGLKIEKPKS